VVNHAAQQGPLGIGRSNTPEPKREGGGVITPAEIFTHYNIKEIPEITSGDTRPPAGPVACIRGVGGGPYSPVGGRLVLQ
jgi:hypothetical protein